MCRNCDTPLFKPRESRWIELQPGDAAHLILARAVSAYWPACTATGGMLLAGGTQTLSLPFKASFCGEIAASAWRSGKYDGDPMNIEYDRKESCEQGNGWAGLLLARQKWLASITASQSLSFRRRGLGARRWNLPSEGDQSCRCRMAVSPSEFPPQTASRQLCTSGWTTELTNHSPIPYAVVPAF